MKNYYCDRKKVSLSYIIILLMSYIIINGIILINALCKNNILKLLNHNPRIKGVSIEKAQ